MTSQRRADIAHGLRLWATCGKKEAEIDAKLKQFIAERSEVIAELKKTESDLKALELQRLQLTSSVLNSWFSMTEEGATKTASANDLLFWNRLMTVSPETYEFLQPRWEKLEKLLVSAKLKEHNKERSERVARLLVNDKPSTPTKEDKKGEHHEADKEGQS